MIEDANQAALAVEKVEPELLEKLKALSGLGELVRVLLKLNVAAQTPSPSAPAGIKDRRQMREYLIQQRLGLLERELQPTLNELRARNLKVHGGKIAPVVVVEGTADDILRSVTLEKVQRIAPDSELRFVQPERPKHR